MKFKYLKDIPLDLLRKVVKEKDSYSHVLDFFGFKNSNNTSLKNIIKSNNIDISHFKSFNEHFSYLRLKNTIPLDKVLIKDSNYNRGSLKARLLRGGYLKDECSKCGLGPEWCGEKLSLQIDHINGVRNDHRLENLRILCPNCHTQTHTYAGKSNKVKILEKCSVCLGGLTKYSKTGICGKCNLNIINNSPSKIRKVKDRPSIETLRKLLEEHSFLEVGRMYGVSDNAVRKWFRLAGENPPTRKPKKVYTCSLCPKEIRKSIKSGKCHNCMKNDLRINRRKYVRPPYEELIEKKKKMNYTKVGRLYGVSGYMIKSWITDYEKTV